MGSQEERIAKLSEDGVRIGMKQDVIDRPHPRTDWSRLQVVEVAHERNLQYEGLSIADIAEAEANIRWMPSWISLSTRIWRRNSPIPPTTGATMSLVKG